MTSILAEEGYGGYGGPQGTAVKECCNMKCNLPKNPNITQSTLMVGFGNVELLSHSGCVIGKVPVPQCFRWQLKDVGVADSSQNSNHYHEVIFFTASLWTDWWRCCCQSAPNSPSTTPIEHLLEAMWTVCLAQGHSDRHWGEWRSLNQQPVSHWTSPTPELLLSCHFPHAHLFHLKFEPMTMETSLMKSEEQHAHFFLLPPFHPHKLVRVIAAIACLTSPSCSLKLANAVRHPVGLLAPLARGTFKSETDGSSWWPGSRNSTNCFILITAFTESTMLRIIFEVRTGYSLFCALSSRFGLKVIRMLHLIVGICVDSFTEDNKRNLFEIGTPQVNIVADCSADANPRYIF